MRRFAFSLGALSALFLALALISGGRAQAQAAVTIAVDLDPAATTGIRIEGLASDTQGRLYTSDLDSRRLWRYTPSSNQLELLGTMPRQGSGMAFDRDGNLYLASGDVVMRINASAIAGAALDATGVVTYATGVPGANGLAFGSDGRLFVSGGNTGNIYVVSTAGITSTWASGFTSDREAQRISTNGLAFGPDGMLYSSNTGTGAIDRIPLNADGSAGTTERFATSELLLGADGITFASNGDLYVAANERNAIVRVSRDGTVSDVASNGADGPLQFPASPSFSGNALYASNFDIERGANAPNAGGVGASLARIDVGVTGAPLPFAGGTQVGTPTAAATGVATGTVTVTATVAVETPTVAATVPVAEATSTTAAVPPAAVIPPTTVPLPTTPIIQRTVAPVTPPGMPATGGGDMTWLLAAVGVALAMVALVAGAAARRATR
jgi:sugar lactone lactonase YvrE